MRPILALMALLLCGAADRDFITTDGVRLHYTDQGRGPAIVMIPGWTMPAWIFNRQIADFSRRFRVIAFDPRGQGDSDIAVSGYEPYRRGRDIAELLSHVADPAPVLLGWSLGVLDVLSYIHQFGDTRIAALILVDNSVGEGPPPRPQKPQRHPPHAPSHAASMYGFVRGMFRTPQPPDYLELLTQASQRTPAWAAAALRNYHVPREFWKTAIYSTDKPILYLVTPRLQIQADALAQHHPGAEAIVLRDVGHAMFVDDPEQFDRLVSDFLRRRVWR